MEENMEKAQVRDAIHQEMFYFRRKAVPEDEDDEAEQSDGADQSTAATTSHDQEYTLLSLNTIMNGKACDRSHDRSHDHHRKLMYNSIVE